MANMDWKEKLKSLNLFNRPAVDNTGMPLENPLTPPDVPAPGSIPTVEAANPQDTSNVTLAPKPTPSMPQTGEDKVMSYLSTSQDIDADRRKKFEDQLNKRKQMGVASTLGGGIADAFNASNRATFGSDVGQTSFAKDAQTSLDKGIEEDKSSFDKGLKTDANSGLSQQYQEAAKLMLGGKNPGLWQGRSAEQISAVLPMVEKYMATKETATQRAQAAKDAQLSRESLAREGRLSRESIAEQNRLQREQMAQDKLDEKHRLEGEKKDNALKEAKQQADVILQSIKDIEDKGLVGYDTAGITGSKILAPIDYGNLQAKLNTITGNIAFDKLQKLRQASPTGGAVGNVSDNDMNLLKSVLGSLDQKLNDPQQLKEALNSLKSVYTKVQGYGDGVEPIKGIDDGRVTVSNGSKTYKIPAAKVAEAEKDGFKVVQ